MSSTLQKGYIIRATDDDGDLFYGISESHNQCWFEQPLESLIFETSKDAYNELIEKILTSAIENKKVRVNELLDDINILSIRVEEVSITREPYNESTNIQENLDSYLLMLSEIQEKFKD
jgi:hypothetical protein